MVETDNTVTYTPDANYNGTDTFTYDISDGNGGTDTATVTITITPVNDAPIADAGPDQATTANSGVALDGSGSSDADGDTLTYQWSIASAPSGSTAVLAGETTVAPTFTPDIEGTYTLQLIVNDGSLDSAPDTMSLTVSGNVLTLSLEDQLIGLGRTTTATATLVNPAPVGGLTVTLSLDDPLVTFPTTIFFPEGATTTDFELAGILEGITTLRGNGTGLAEATATLEVTSLLISIDLIEDVAPDESTSVVISITEPAPPQGLEITLTVADPSIATVDPIVLFVPAGEQIPTANSQLTGHILGLTSVKATAPGYAPDTRSSLVTINAAFDPLSLNVPQTFTRTIVLTLDAPAPTGGLTFDLILDDPVATVPATVFITEGQTQTPPITVEGGAAPATTQLRASAPFVAEATATINVTDVPDAYLNRSAYVAEAIIGDGLQLNYSVRLEVAPVDPVDVIVSVPAGSDVLLSTDRDAVGGTSLTFEDLVGTGTPAFYIQGVALGDDVPFTIDVFERNTLIPAEYQSRLSTVDVDPAGVYMITSDYATTTFSSNRNINAAIGVLYDTESTRDGEIRQGQAPRGGTTIDVPVASSAPSVADVTAPNFTFTPASSNSNVSVDPQTAGVATITLAPLPPLTVPTNLDDNVVVTVDAAEAYLNRSAYVAEAIIGDGLQLNYNVRMAQVAPAPVDVTVSVPVGSDVLLSTDRDTAGTSAITFLNVATSNTPTFYIQGVALGDDVPFTIDIVNAGTTDITGYAIRPSTVDVDPAGVYMITSDYATTTFSSNRNINAAIGVLYDTESTRDGEIRQGQAPRGGTTIDVPVASSAPSVADVTAPNFTFTPASSNSNVSVDPQTAGVATITLAPLPPLTVPTNLDDNVVVTVDAPDTYLRTLNGANVTLARIGDELQVQYNVRLQETPPNPVDVVVEIVAGSVARVSTDPTVLGTNTVTFSGVTSINAGTLYIQGLDLNSATQLRITAAGYDDWIADIEIIPSGFALPSSVSATAAGATRNVNVTAYALNANETVLQAQSVRGGASFEVFMSSGDVTVGTVPASVVIASGATVGTFIFTGVSPGTTTVTITQPAGFVEPAGRGSLNFTVN